MKPTPIQLRILGPIKIVGDGPEASALSRQPKRLALLSYLAIATSEGFRRRDQVTGLFWPEHDQAGARTQLRKALYGIREAFGKEIFLTRGEGEIRIDDQRILCDATELRRHTREGNWDEAVSLYRGELLDGMFAEGVSHEFEEWLRTQRQSLRRAAAQAAAEFSRVEERNGNRQSAIRLARRALDIDPDNEEFVRHLITILDRIGDRGTALRVYGDWQERLQKEFGVEPAPETRWLARQVQAPRNGESLETPPTLAAIRAPVATAITSSLIEPDQTAAERMRPRRMSGRQWLASGTVVIMLAIGAGAIFLAGRSPGALPVSKYSVAVLPLQPIGNGNLESAAAAVAEELTTDLARSPGITVRPAARARNAIIGSADLPEIGRRLGVTHLVDGAIQQNAGELRVTLRLIRQSDGVAVWAGAYRGKVVDASAIGQSVSREATREISRRILVIRKN